MARDLFSLYKRVTQPPRFMLHSKQASKQARKKPSECVIRLMADKISPEAVEILQRLGEIKNKIQELISPLRFQVTFQKLL